MKFNLKQLQAFVWVADLKSFRKTAERLNTTQPNISGRIASLEQLLDVHLMERDAGSVRLTAKGKKLLQHARQVLQASDAFNEAAGNKMLLDGVLKLGVTEMIAGTWLRDYLKALKEYYPHNTVELMVDISINLEKELFEHNLDLALQNEPFSRQATGNIDLGIYPLIWAASPSLKLHQQTNISLSALAQYPILTHSRNSRLYQDVAEHFAMHQINARLVPSSHLTACLNMAADGLGIAIIPQAMGTEYLQNNELVQLNYTWTPPSLHFLARYEAQSAPLMVVHAAQIAKTVAVAYQAKHHKS